MENIEKKEIFALGRSPFKIYESIKWMECDSVKINHKDVQLSEGWSHTLAMYLHEKHVAQISYFTYENDLQGEIEKAKNLHLKTLVNYFIKPMSEFLEKLESNVALQA